MVISEDAFNRIGLISLCPITLGVSQSRFASFAVNLLGSGTTTQGVALSDQLGTLDLWARRGSFVAHAPEFVVEKIWLACKQSLSELAKSASRLIVAPNAQGARIKFANPNDAAVPISTHSDAGVDASSTPA